MQRPSTCPISDTKGEANAARPRAELLNPLRFANDSAISFGPAILTRLRAVPSVHIGKLGWAQACLNANGSLKQSKGNLRRNRGSVNVAVRWRPVGAGWAPG